MSSVTCSWHFVAADVRLHLKHKLRRSTQPTHTRRDNDAADVFCFALLPLPPVVFRVLRGGAGTGWHISCTCKGFAALCWDDLFRLGWSGERDVEGCGQFTVRYTANGRCVCGACITQTKGVQARLCALPSARDERSKRARVVPYYYYRGNNIRFSQQMRCGFDG